MRSMANLAIVSYPVLEPADRDWIESLRMQHDPQATMLPAHVTLVFPAQVRADNLGAEIAAVASVTTAIPFVIRWARPVRGAVEAGGHVFLVPDDGFGEIAALHEALYGGAFSASRRADVPFIPHVTVAANRDFGRCEQIARDLTPLDRLIRGRLQTIDLLEIAPGTVKSLQRFDLRL